MKKGFFDFLILFLVIQLICPVNLLADNVNNGNSAMLEDNYSRTQNRYPTKDLSTDLGLLTRQYRVDFIYENGVRKEGRRESLTDFSLEHQRPSILNPAKDLSFDFNEDTKELWIIFSQKSSKKTEKSEAKVAHIIKGITVTSNILVDDNMVVFATPEGIRATLIDRIVNCGFIEPVLFPIVGVPVELKSGAKILNIKTIGLDEDLSKYIKDLDQKLHAGDFILELETSENGSSHRDYMVLEKSVVIMNLRAQLIGTLFLSSFYLDRKNQQELISEIEDSLFEDKEEIDVSSNEAILNESDSDDLITKALKNMAAGNKLKTILPLLKKSFNGRDVLATYADLLKTRTPFTTEDTKNIEELVKRYEEQTGPISEETRIEIQREYFQGLFNAKVASLESTISEVDKTDGSTSWLDDVSNRILASESVFQEATKKEENVFKRMLTSTTKLWNSLSKGIKKSLVTVSLGSVIALTYSKLDPAGAKLGLEYIGALITELWNLLNYSTQIPVLSTLTEPIVKCVGYVSQGWLATFRLTVGVGLMLAVYPVSLYLIKLLNLESSKGQSLWQTFFDFGVRWYARICYPTVKFIWDRVLKQKNVYSAMDVGLPPMFNGVFSSNTKIKEKTTKKLNSYSKKQDLSFITKIIAAAIVGDLSEIDIKSLLLLESGSQIKEVASILKGSSISSSSFVAIENIVYTTLLEVANNQELVADIDEQELEKYVKVFLDVKKKVQGSNIEDIGVLNTAYKTFKKTVSDGIIPGVLFGKQGLDFYNKYKNAVVDANTATIAGLNYQNDFLFSTIVYATASAEKVAIGALGNIEVAANQLSQAFVYGLQGAVDPLTVSETNFAGSNDFILTPVKKSQSLWESFKTMFSSSPILSTTGYLESHTQYIKNLFIGFKVRFLVDYITRVPGLIITKILLTGMMLTWSQMGHEAAKAIFLSAFFLIAKISVSPFFIGYAVVWPYVHMAMKKNRNSVGFNNALLNNISSFIYKGVVFNDIEATRKAVLGLKTLYVFSKRDVPEQFRKDVKDFTVLDALNFWQYTNIKQHLPVSTEVNHAVDIVLTMIIGAWISTVLFTGISGVLYDDIPFWGAVSLLMEALLFVSLTYGVLKTGSWIMKNMFNRKVEKELDPEILEKINKGEKVDHLTREDVAKTIDKIQSTTISVAPVDCSDLFTK